MENNTTALEKLGAFFRKYAWLMAIAFAVLAIAFTFLPVVNYVIKEKVFIIADGESKTFKIGHDVNLITYFSSGFKLNFTFYITIGLLVCGAGLAGASKLRKDLLTAAGLFFLLAMCMFILSQEFFKADENCVMDYAKIVNETNAEQTFEGASFSKATLSWGAYFGIVFSSIAFACTTLSSEKRTVRQITEEGILISLALILNFIKIPVGPTGGSVNFQMLPLMLIALRHGPSHGFIAGGIVYGLLSCLLDGYGFACYPFDYLIGFGSVAVMGFFRKFIFSEDQETYNVKGLVFIFVAGLLSTMVRYVGSTVSSIVVYGLTLVEALEYQAFYVPLSGLLAIVALMAMYGPLLKVNKSHPVEQNEIENA